MKNRDYKEFSKGTVAHIYNRGNNKEKIFFDNQDYKAFLYRLGMAIGVKENELNKHSSISMPYSRIRIESHEKQFKILAFCLMPNHFHLLIEQTGEIPVSKLILKICTSYVKYINQKYNRVGHLFQDQFKSVVIDSDPQLMWTFAYIHTNPVKHKIVNDLSKYNWSSYKEYSGERSLPIVETGLFIEKLGKPEDFEKEIFEILKEYDVKGHL